MAKIVGKYTLTTSILFFISVACMEVPCRQDNVFNFDRRGRPLKISKKKDPPYFMMKRCPKKQCHTRKIHCHGNTKYRGTGLFARNKNPATGEDIEIMEDK